MDRYRYTIRFQLVIQNRHFVDRTTQLTLRTTHQLLAEPTGVRRHQYLSHLVAAPALHWLAAVGETELRRPREPHLVQRLALRLTLSASDGRCAARGSGRGRRGPALRRAVDGARQAIHALVLGESGAIEGTRQRDAEAKHAQIRGQLGGLWTESGGAPTLIRPPPWP